ncbi:MAG: hypothetical protein N3G77_07550 [Nitrososphaeria archaeon]|nr:hypothetical protein [Nitrososphaeria archaeon]
MTWTVTLLLKVKLKQYLGQVRRSIRNLLSLILVYLLWLMVIGSISIVLRNTGISSGSQDFLKILSEVTVIAILAVGAFLGIKGGVTALPYELDYVLSSNIRPRIFLITDLLFQLFLLTFFIIPPTSLMLTILTYPNHFTYLGRAIPLYMLIILMSIMLSHVLGVSRSILSENRVKMIGWIILVIILSPLILLALKTPPPSLLMLHPALVLSSAIDRPSENFYWMMPYLLILGLAYLHLSKTNFYSSVSPLLYSILMEPPSKLTKYIKLPIRIEKILGLKLAKGYSSLMYILHLLRVLREGSLWTGVIVLLFLTLVNTAIPRLISVAQFPEVAELTMIALYIPLLPALLAINWSISERPNTWIVNLSTRGERYYISGLFFAYLTVTFPFSLCLYGVVSMGSTDLPFIIVDVILLLAMSCFGSALSILISLVARIALSPLSLSSLLYILTPLVGSSLLSLPILTIRLYEPLASSPTIGLTTMMLVYIGISSFILYTIIVRGGVRYLK